jgi:hypothetical protein
MENVITGLRQNIQKRQHVVEIVIDVLKIRGID